jgi:hypothetical protein
VAVLVLIWVLAVFASAWLYRHLAGGSISPARLNYFSTVFLVGLCVFSMPGALFVALGAADTFFFIEPIASRVDAKVMALYMLCWTAVATPLASLAVLLLLGRHPPTMWRCYESAPMDLGACSNWAQWTLVMWALFAVYVASFLVVQAESYPSPLLMSIAGAPDAEIAQRRIEVTRLYEGARPVKSLMNLLGPVLLFGCLALRRAYPPARLLLWIVAPLVAVAMLSDSEKAPLVYLIIGVITALTYSGTRVTLARAGLVFASVLAAIVGMYYIFYSDVVEGGWLAERVFERIFVAQMSAVPLAAAEYPSRVDFIGFASLDSIVHRMLDVDPAARASEYLLEQHFPLLAAAGGWNVNGIYIHEAWANFGWVGLVLGPAFVGAVHALAVHAFTRVRKTPFAVGLFAYLSADITLFITGFNRYLFNTGLLHLVVLWAVVTGLCLLARLADPLQWRMKRCESGSGEASIEGRVTP